MSLRFVIESAPSPQAQMERVFTGGQLSIGRSSDADWQVEDPKMFVSRRHCVISEQNGQVVVTDASSGGLYIDNAANPVGLGNAVPLEPGMRLHLGDFTLRVEAVSGASETPASPSPQSAPMNRSFFPAEDDPVKPVDQPERPASLPDPFGIRDSAHGEARHKEVARPPRPLDQADPFGLDLRKSAAEEPQSRPPRTEPSISNNFFDETPEPARRDAAPETEPSPEKSEKPFDIFGDWHASDSPAKHGTETPSVEEAVKTDMSSAPAEDLNVAPRVSAPPETKPTSTPIGSTPTTPPAPRNDEDLRDALLRGMGLDPSQTPSEDSLAEMEHLGQCMRSLVEGLMLLLRTRAQEKQKVRVAQTIIASADVNPLKFLATPEDALSALIRPRGKGYMAPDAAVEGAFRDLMDHQVRTWSALQVALRQMVDKFDPSEIEKEMEDVGLLESLVAGGRSAKLWQIYEDRYRDIAETAEKQFLGEVGADFRDAYENRRSD